MNKMISVIAVALCLVTSQGFAQGNRPAGGGSSAAPTSPADGSMRDMRSSRMGSGPMGDQDQMMDMDPDQMRDQAQEHMPDDAMMGRPEMPPGQANGPAAESRDRMEERQQVMEEDREEMMNRERADMPEDAMMGRPEELPEQANERAVEMQERSEERQEIMEEAREEGTEPGRKPWWKFWGD